MTTIGSMLAAKMRVEARPASIDTPDMCPTVGAPAAPPRRDYHPCARTPVHHSAHRCPRKARRPGCVTAGQRRCASAGTTSVGAAVAFGFSRRARASASICFLVAAKEQIGQPARSCRCAGQNSRPK